MDTEKAGLIQTMASSDESIKLIKDWATIQPVNLQKPSEAFKYGFIVPLWAFPVIPHNLMQEVGIALHIFLDVFAKISGRNYIFIYFCFDIKAGNKT